MTDIKQKVFEFRQVTGLTVGQIASEIGYRQQTVYNYLAGRKGSKRIGAALSRFIDSGDDLVIGQTAETVAALRDHKLRTGATVYDIARDTGLSKSAVAQYLASGTGGPYVHRTIAQHLSGADRPRQIGFAPTAMTEDGSGSTSADRQEKGRAESTPVENAADGMMRQELSIIMERCGISQSSLARSIGVSAGALSAWLRGKYTGDAAKISEKVASYLIIQRERAELPQADIRFVRTTIAAKIFEVARIAHLDGEIALVYGDAGLGKTRAVAEYAAANPDVILIEADLGYSAKVLFVELCRHLGIAPDQSLHDMLDAVVTKLKKTGRLIIVDEAEHLPYKALEMLRRVYDKAGTGILLVGMPRLLFNLRGKRGEYAQLYSRVGIAAKIEHLRESDTESLVKAAIPGSNGVWKTFHKEALGNTRRLAKLISRSQRTAQINKMSLDASVVEETSKLLII